MAETHSMLFPRFSAARVATALKDTPVDEIDIVVESDSAALVGIEVKAASTVNTADFKGLRKLAMACEEDFKIGVVFYDGENVVPFGNRLFAAPMSCLWG